MTKNNKKAKSSAPKNAANKVVAAKSLVPAEPQKTAPLKAEPAKPSPAPVTTSKPAPEKPILPIIAAAQSEAVKPAALPAKAAPAPAKSAAPTRSTISLEFLKPEAKTVLVAGTFNGWKPEHTPLTAQGNGRWVGSLAVGPGRYEYLFVVDGQWLPDPNARESVENPYGGRNSVLTVSE